MGRGADRNRDRLTERLVTSPALCVGAVVACLAATAAAWRARAVDGLLAAGLSTGGVTAAATSWAATSAALAFAAVSLGATAVGAGAGRLLDDEDHDPHCRR